MRALAFLLAFLASLSSWAGSAVVQGVLVQGVRLKAAPDSTRMVLDLSGPARHRIEAGTAPRELIITLDHATWSTAQAPVRAQGLVRAFEVISQHGDMLRLRVALSAEARPESFTLAPNAGYGHRLVLDLYPQGATKNPDPPAAELPRISTAPAARRWIIAVDAGHGGADPGALGKLGTREKDVTLAVARKLAARINRASDMRAVLIRDGDYFVPLRQRIQRARQHEADLFISIHADAAPNGQAHGSSVYTLSERGATSEAARWLAARENAADLVGGVSLGDKDDMLASVLLDLSQTATHAASVEAAERILDGMVRVGAIHKIEVQRAGFAVLKSPDIPSVLVETAFISTPAEERQLRDPKHQDFLADAVLSGIRAYFAGQNPQRALQAAR